MMSYGSWGTFVYRNGERMESHEDAIPGDGLDMCHAVLGQGRVRLCGYKGSPILYVDGASVDLEPYVTERDPFTNLPLTWEGEVEGYRFKADFDGYTLIDLELTEPDGTVWTSTCGYEYGAGWMDD